MATDRTTLRRTIGYRLGDMLLLRATHASGDPNQFRDVVNLGDRGDNAPSVVNKIAYLSGGTETNLGHEARISAFEGATRILTFDPPAPTTANVGDELELWSTSERVGSIATLHGFINDAIRAVQNEVATEVWDDPVTFRARSPVLTIPSTWAEIGGATWIDRAGGLHDVPPDQITVYPGTRQLRINGRPAWRANNLQVQLWGYPQAGALTADSGAEGQTEVDAEWIVETVLSWVAIAASSRASDIRAPSEERRGNFWATQAAMYRRNVGAARRGLGISL